MKKLLFVCSENRLRSPTAEVIFSKYNGIKAIGCGTNKDAKTPISGKLIEWADIVIVMEKHHRNKILSNFKHLLKGKRFICLDIPDKYGFMQPELVNLLKVKVSKYGIL